MSPSTELAPRPAPGGLALHTLSDYQKLAEVLSASGIFGAPAVCLVKILAGRELGFGAVASLQNIHVTEDGKLIVGYVIQAAMVRASGRYDYRENERTDAACSLTFLRREGTAWKELGTERITLADAQAKGWHLTKGGKGKEPWFKTPANMLFARCVTNGFKAYCPDLSAGISLYDPDELDAAGPAIDAEFTVTPPAGNGRPLHPDEAAHAAGPDRGGPGPNPQAPAVATSPPAAVTEEQQGALAALVRARGRTTEDVQAMLASRGLKALAQLPQAWLPWAMSILTDGQASTQQLDRISALVTRLNIPQEKVDLRLRQKYGVDRLRLLTTLQATEVEAALSAAPKQAPAPQPAAAPG